MDKLHANSKLYFEKYLDYMNFILIGKGKWGKKLYKNLLKIGKVQGVVTSKNDVKNFNLNITSVILKFLKIKRLKLAIKIILIEAKSLIIVLLKH